MGICLCAKLGARSKPPCATCSQQESFRVSPKTNLSTFFWIEPDWANKNIGWSGSTQILEKIGRVAQAHVELLCEIPCDLADLELGNMATGKRDTIKQHNNKPIGNIQYNNTATLRAVLRIKHLLRALHTIRADEPLATPRNPRSAEEWRNCTLVGHEPLICIKMCFAKTEQ